MRESRLLVTFVLIAFVGLGSLWSPSTASAQIDISRCFSDSEYRYANCYEAAEFKLTCEVFHELPFYEPDNGACEHARDAAKWVFENEGKVFEGQIGEGQIGNAWAHCAWMGALATRVGIDSATSIGSLFERVFENPEASTLMDLMNNHVGAQIGVDAVESGTDDTWGYVMKECESRAKSGDLYGPCGIPGSYNPPYAPYDPDNPPTC